ncbi:HNH endonuclease [Candidatus Daviesbacteria bacterium]|nr:HNH endonuclease [Candidatus Daviesbacteria bacterium]
MSDFKFEFGRSQISKIPREKVIAELEKVAKHFNYTDFKQDDFDKIADISYYKVYREFGSWENALKFLVEHFKKQDIDFKLTTRRSSYTVQEMFDEMERIWVQLGHRPSRDEWVASNPRISYDSIYRRFGSWTEACLKFIEYKSGGAIPEVVEVSEVRSEAKLDNAIANKDIDEKRVVEKTRTVPLSVRIKVLSRDNFRCVFCGKSPATDIGTRLHIDHVIPFSKGGTNVAENLQTLCEECNLGKSDRKIVNTTK